MFKKIQITTVFVFMIFLIGISNTYSADGVVKIDSISDDIDLVVGSDGVSNKNICLDENGVLSCVAQCIFYEFEDGGHSFYLSEDKSGFMCINNEGYGIDYYNLVSGKLINVGSKIYSYLSQFKNSEVYRILIDSSYDPFYKENFSQDKTGYVLKINQDYEAGLGGAPTALLCILDLEKLSNDESDFFTCPVITDYVEIDREKTENVWLGTDSVFFMGWKNDNELELKDTVQSFDYAENDKSIQVSYNLNLDSNELKVTNIDNPDDEPYFLDLSFSNPLFHKVIKANSQGWITGYPDGTVRLNDPVNRAEFAKMLTIAFTKGVGNGGNLQKFPDVYFDQWYVPYLSKAVELGSMSGYPDGKMRPGNNINRAEALKMALELVQIPFIEVPANSPWYEKYRKHAINDGYDLDFLDVEDMSEDMTRGECIELILEALEDLGPG